MILELVDVTKSYFTSEVETLALSHISISIKQGEFLAIMGPRVAASRPCSTFWASSTARARVVFSSSARRLGAPRNAS
jgi:hypothetical protein